MLRSDEQNLTSSRILVVDDDRLIREMTRDALEEEGFRVDVASSGADALAQIQRNSPYNVVVTDLSMPEMDGLELTERMKAANPGLDVIVLTGHVSLESALQALRLGAADYLRKPVEGPEIVYCVKRTILRRGLLSENESLRGWVQALESSRVLTSSLETQDILPLAIDIVLRLLGRDRAVGRVLHSDPHLQHGICLRGFSTQMENLIRDQIHARKDFDVTEHGPSGPTLGSDMSTSLEELGIVDDLLVLPISIESRVIGGLWVFSEGREFREDEVERAKVVVAQAELALVNAEKFIRARERAFVDDVTDLYNARYLLAAIEREVSRAHRYGLEVSVLFLDLDHFKLVNDEHGHLVGSGVLRELGVVLQQCVRSIDTVGRYGGDEFALLLVDTGLFGAHQVAERIRRTVAAHTFRGERDLELRLTLSAGVSTYPLHGVGWRDLLEKADKSMYLAKALGRDRVCSADDLRAKTPSSGVPRVL